MDVTKERDMLPVSDYEDVQQMAEAYAKLPPDVRKKIGYVIEGAKLVSEALVDDKAS